jgi:hypothetical protein
MSELGSTELPPGCGDDAATPQTRSRRGWLRRAVLFPQAYVWFVFLSCLDLMFTRVILQIDGREVNALADWVIRTYNFRGLVAFKFSMVVLVVLICELVGRRRPETGVKLSRWAIILTAFPVLIGAMNLLHLIIAPHGIIVPAESPP